jgi:hypothetical protein
MQVLTKREHWTDAEWHLRLDGEITSMKACSHLFELPEESQR